LYILKFLKFINLFMQVEISKKYSKIYLKTGQGEEFSLQR